jgi:ABC-2 type transport system permease protein
MSRLVGALRAELLKMDRRPAVWILLGVALSVLVLLGYLLQWLVFTHPPQGMNLASGNHIDQKQALYPPHVISTAVRLAASTGSLPGALALILGVLVVGSEFGWGTFKTIYTQGPGRIETLTAKLLALEAALGAGVLLYFAAAAVSSLTLAMVDGQPLDQWPAGLVMIQGMLASWLSWSWWCLFGCALAFAFRQSALPIGLGLAYAFVIEVIILSLGGAFGGDFIKSLQRIFPGPNSGALAAAFQDGIPNVSAGPPVASPEQAAVVLVLYCAAAILVCAVLVTRREVK